MKRNIFFAILLVLGLSACSDNQTTETTAAAPTEATAETAAEVIQTVKAEAAETAGTVVEQVKETANEAMVEVEGSADAMVEKAEAEMTQAKEAMQDAVVEAQEKIAAVAAVASTARDGETIYNKHCVACHAAGIAGAPKLGDATAWAEREAKGADTLLANSISGINAMPAKGTCMDCSEAEMQATIEYMLAQSK